MTRMKRYFFLAAAFLAAFAIVPQAQMRVVPVDEEQGHIALASRSVTWPTPAFT